LQSHSSKEARVEICKLVGDLELKYFKYLVYSLKSFFLDKEINAVRTWLIQLCWKDQIDVITL